MKIFHNPLTTADKSNALIARWTAAGRPISHAGAIDRALLERVHDSAYVAARLDQGEPALTALDNSGAVVAAAHYAVVTGHTGVAPVYAGGAGWNFGTDTDPFNGIAAACSVAAQHGQKIAVLDCNVAPSNLESCLKGAGLGAAVNCYHVARWFNRPIHAKAFLEGIPALMDTLCHSCPVVLYVAGCGALGHAEGGWMDPHQIEARDIAVLREIRRLGRSLILCTGDGYMPPALTLDLQTKLLEHVKNLVDKR